MTLPYKILAMVLLCAALIAGYFGWQTHQRAIGAEEQRQVDDLAIQAQKNEAARILATETAKVMATEKTLRAFVSAQEVQSVKDQRVAADLGRKLRDASVDGRLRDPFARSGDCGATPDSGTAAPPGDSPGDPTPAGGLFSAEATQLLTDLTAEADEMSNAYTACRAWAVEVKDKTSVSE